jgi:hypothetical protein
MAVAAVGQLSSRSGILSSYGRLADNQGREYVTIRASRCHFGAAGRPPAAHATAGGLGGAGATQERGRPGGGPVAAAASGAARKEARGRAAQEQRPILLLVVTNSYGDLFTGHC